MIHLHWCITCGHWTRDVLEASAHQYPPTNHIEIRKIGTLP